MRERARAGPAVDESEAVAVERAAESDGEALGGRRKSGLPAVYTRGSRMEAR